MSARTSPGTTATTTDGTGTAPVGRALEDDRIVERTRTGSAWLIVAAALLLGLLMLVFILQNSEKVDLELLWADFRVPLGVAVLLGMVLGGLLVVLVTAARLAQVRLAARRHRKAHAA